MVSTTTDIFTWQVSYAATKDGGVINEYDPERPDGRGFAEVALAHASHIALLSEGQIIHTVHIPAGATPIFFRRRRIELAGEGEAGRYTTHCIGWQHDRSAVYLFVFEDGRTLLSDDLQAV